MTLLTEVQRRLSTGILKDLTNQGTTGTSVVEVEDITNAAIEDAKEEFLDETGLTFDETDNGHIRAGIMGVLYYLHTYTNKSTESLERQERRWLKALQQISRTRGAERRILPATSVLSEPSVPTAGLLPEEDITRWNEYTLDSPLGSDRDDLIRGG